ncbi:carbamoyltransferase [Crossiella equi]|uniref:Carbamoyltransferase n=1 Tax=Crossiella equi TaxID=130796 RepID=A0ABS5A5Q3_9PSEU|nr:carbamoyltransferase C-terminal domain-containing protein [Crossiella equi]MBP2471934.1 carbamoyltransferase [Crossiella equi]
MTDPYYLGVMTGPHDPSAALVRGGRVLALADEERFSRNKHAFGCYPVNAIRYCLDSAGITLSEVAGIAMPWDVDGYTDGAIASFYDGLARTWPVDEATRGWQRAQLATFNRDSLRRRHGQELRRAFGQVEVPEVTGTGHHLTHAFQAAHESPYERAVVLVLDGSGDTHCGTVWLKAGTALELLREVEIPHSIGWFYAAMTEYLGFDSSDGEYKVMGLAAHGEPDPKLAALVEEVLHEAPDGVEYRVDPRYLHYGPHTHSGRFTDLLVELFGRQPRSRREPVEQWHMDLALAAQHATEEAACRLVSWAVRRTGVPTVCVGGGVAMNVKMNARIAGLPGVRGVFAHPGCADNGAAAGSALLAAHRATGVLPEPLRTMALGPSFSEAEIEAVLRRSKVAYERLPDPAPVIARELANGAVVGWFTGRMEAGARALGQRSILADPRTTAMRDRVNEVIKHREPWRPFAPSVPDEDGDAYADPTGDARFMMMGFPATERLRADAPAVVHVDGTSRVHRVVAADNPAFHRLLREFGALTGVPVLLNTSFNVAGEPIVCTPSDALRTFYSSGLDLLAIGNFVVRKKPC